MNSPTRVFFFGTPEIAVPSLKSLAADSSIEVVGVGVFPDRPVGRKQVLTPCPVKVAAQELNLPVTELSSKADLVALFNAPPFDLGVVIAFGMIFPGEILSLPRLGVVNVHFSLLPSYRGASPVQSAILNGDHLSGITWQRMVTALDAGDILRQIEYPLKDQSTASIWSEMADITAKSFPQFVHDYDSELIEPIPQDESQATFCSTFTRADGEIFPTIETAETIYRKYRAFDPWPGIFLETESGRIKILKCHLTQKESTIPLLCAEETELHLETVQKAGKQSQAATLLSPSNFS